MKALIVLVFVIGNRSAGALFDDVPSCERVRDRIAVELARSFLTERVILLCKQIGGPEVARP